MQSVLICSAFINSIVQSVLIMNYFMILLCREGHAGAPRAHGRHPGHLEVSWANVQVRKGVILPQTVHPCYRIA